MKKWPILAAALLLALSGVQKLRRHEISPENTAFPSAPQPGMVSLPDGASVYAIPGEFSAVPARSAAPSTYGALPTIKDKAYDSGPCKGGSLNEIFSAHGRIWGYLAPYGSFQSAHNADMYDLLGRYLSCVGLARGNPSFCDYLPGESRGGKGGVPLTNSPNYKCMEYYLAVSTKAGAAGGCPEGYSGLCSAFLSKSEASCSAMLAKLGSSYCGYLAKAQKRAGGYAGFTPDEVKAVFQKDKEQKAAMERLRLENEKTTEEINAKVRKLMGKPAAPGSK